MIQNQKVVNRMFVDGLNSCFTTLERLQTNFLKKTLSSLNQQIHIKQMLVYEIQ